MEDAALPLPSLEEVLICNPNTTTEEVRARVPPSYTIVHTVHEYAHKCRWIICLSLQLPSNQIFVGKLSVIIGLHDINWGALDHASHAPRHVTTL